MQNGYQDVGSWTFFKDHDANKTAAAWLYAQFVTAKTTSLKKTLGLTRSASPDIQSRPRPTQPPSWVVWSSSTAALPAWHGHPPVPTCLITPSWPSCGGRTWPRP